MFFRRKAEEDSCPKLVVLEALVAHAEEFSDKWNVEPYYARFNGIDVWVGNDIDRVHVKIDNVKIESENIPLSLRRRLYVALCGNMKPYKNILNKLKES